MAEEPSSPDPILGEGHLSTRSVDVNPDHAHSPAGSIKGKIVITTNVSNGKSKIQMTLTQFLLGTPLSATIKEIGVQGYREINCTGKDCCTKFITRDEVVPENVTPPELFKVPVQNPTGWIFEPNAHDFGLITISNNFCTCDEHSISSRQVVVNMSVKFRKPDGTIDETDDIFFQTCINCTPSI